MNLSDIDLLKELRDELRKMELYRLALQNANGLSLSEVTLPGCIINRPSVSEPVHAAVKERIADIKQKLSLCGVNDFSK